MKQKNHNFTHVILNLRPLQNTVKLCKKKKKEKRRETEKLLQENKDHYVLFKPVC